MMKLVKEAHKVNDKVFWNFYLSTGSNRIAIKPSFDEDKTLLSFVAILNPQDENDYPITLFKQPSKVKMENGKPFTNYFLLVGYRYFAIKPAFKDGYRLLYFLAKEGRKDVKAE